MQLRNEITSSLLVLLLVSSISFGSVILKKYTFAGGHYALISDANGIKSEIRSNVSLSDNDWKLRFESAKSQSQTIAVPDEVVLSKASDNEIIAEVKKRNIAITKLATQEEIDLAATKIVEVKQ